MMEDTLYIRKLNAQELGFRKGVPHEAGRYIYIVSKFLDYFPPLTTVVLNDYVIIDIYSHALDKLVLAKYVYHNSKLVEGKSHGRNEHRIYLNNDLDPDGEFFQPNDIVIFHKEELANNIIYNLYHYPESRKGEEYYKLEQILEGGIRESHAVVPLYKVPFIVKADVRQVIAKRKVVPQEVIKGLFDEPIISPIEAMERENVTRLLRNASFRDLMLFFYDYKCAVTGTAIRHSGLTNLEAVHIIPKSANGSDNPINGLVLSRDLHWAFDKGLFTIDGEYKIVVHNEIEKKGILDNLHGRLMNLPEDSRAKPNLAAFEWHRKNVYGIYLRSV